MPRRRNVDNIVWDEATVALIEKLAARGAAEIERGDFITISGPEDERKPMRRLNDRAAERAARRSRSVGKK